MVDVDLTEVRELAVVFSRVPDRLNEKIRPAIKKAGVNIKNQLRDEMARSRHFRAAQSISFDVIDGGLGVEVGPRKQGAGNLANIAYFGGVHGGGATVPDPKGALETEAQNFEDWVGKAIEGLLNG